MTRETLGTAPRDEGFGMTKPHGTDRHGSRRFRSEKSLFLWQLLRHPSQVSAVVPSSRKLAREMAAGIPEGAVHVAEFGAGTGRLTRAILKRGVEPRNLHVFEINAAFAARLKLMFPSVRIHERPAQDLSHLGLPPLDAVVSGLPLLSMPEAVRDEIVATALEHLAPAGVFVQFTYGLMSPAPEALLRRFGFDYRRSRRIWSNIPPATVYTYFRSGGTAAKGPVT